MTHLEFPPWLVALALLARLILFVWRWHVNYHWTPLAYAIIIVYLGVIYLATSYGWGGLQDPAMRALWIRPALFADYVGLALLDYLYIGRGKQAKKLIRGFVSDPDGGGLRRAT